MPIRGPKATRTTRTTRTTKTASTTRPAEPLRTPRPRTPPLHPTLAAAVSSPAPWLLCAAFTALFALATELPAHRAWATTATAGYLIAAAAAPYHRRRPRRPLRTPAPIPTLTPFPVPLHLLIAAALTALLPLALLTATGDAQLEVQVVAESASRLLETGTPYHPSPEKAADYNPYLPGTALFGLPSALTGGGALTDPRWWLGLCFAVTTAAALRRTAATRAAPLLLVLLALPPVAMSLAVSGIDLPLIGLMCLGTVLAAQGRAGAAGLALGLASAMKWTAWPALAVACAALAATTGRRAATRCVLLAAAVVAVIVGPVALRDPGAFAQHVIAFPLGLADTPSPAASPLPGRLIATTLPGGTGRPVALTLLCAAALLMAVSLVVRPPVSVRSAANRTALGLLLALTLAPATRYGYLLYPLVLHFLARTVRVDPSSHPPKKEAP
ncbi:glycosyltransferase 87 family protein [Streptomyces sp. NPDC003691]